MSEKPKKPEDPNLIDKHVNSKLFQKFLQKEGDKLAEVNLVQPRSEPISAKPTKRVEVDLSKPAPFKSKPQVEETYWTEPRQREDRSKARFSDELPEVSYNARSNFNDDDEVYVQSYKFKVDSPKESDFRKDSIKSPKYEEKPSRSKWQDEPYQSFRDEDNFPRDSELKGFSDYIPPGESFVYYENLPENPAPKPKTNFVNYYPDPVLALNSNTQQVQNLEEQLRNKDIEIAQYKQDLDHYKSEVQELEEKLDSITELERRMKNLRVERDMIERKSRGFEEENEQLKRQIDLLREDLDNARYKMEDVERSCKGKMQDMEREIRGFKDRVSDLEYDLSREKEKNRSKKAYQEDYQDYEVHDDRKNKWDDYYEDDYKRSKKDEYLREEPRKGKKNVFEEENRRGKKNPDDFYQDPYPEPRKQGRKMQDEVFHDPYPEPRKQGRKMQDEILQDNYVEPRKQGRKQEFYDQYPEKGYSERNPYDKQEDKFRPDLIKEQVKARIGATNSSSVSSALNWGEKPRKNDEMLNLENKILSLQIERKRFEEELAKIPEHAKKIAVIRRREEIENEVAGIHSTIASLKIRVKQLQSKDN